jgi:hypothetical protein
MTEAADAIIKKQEKPDASSLARYSRDAAGVLYNR